MRGSPEGCEKPYRATRRNFGGELRQLSTEGGPVYGFNLSADVSDPEEPPTFEEVDGLFETLRLHFPVAPIGYAPLTSLDREVAAGWLDPGFPIYGLPAGSFVRRGDVNGDGSLNVTDALVLLEYLFRRGDVPSRRKTADADDSGGVQPGDAVAILEQIPGRGQPIAPPFPDCGEDPTSGRISCASYASYVACE